MNARAEAADDAVRVSVPQLVELHRAGAGLRLHAGRILARHGGDYQSPFRGRGMEFDESRLYQPGDDIRNIDWRVTARSGRPHTKLFREERERPVFLWVDFRRPMFFATRGRFKAVIAARLASLIAWSAVQHGDRVGAVIFAETDHDELKPQRGRAAALRLIRRVAQHRAWDAHRTQPADAEAGVRALARLRRVVRPGSLVFLISDFRDLDERAESQLAHVARNADLFLLLVQDPLERELPPPGRYAVSEGAGEFVLDTFDSAGVERYRGRSAARCERWQTLARRHGIRFLICGTQQDPLAALQAGLAARSER